MKQTSNAVPLCCTTDAYQLMSRQAQAIESSDALVSGAVAIALHQLSGVDPQSADITLQRYADTVRSRVRGSQPQALVAHLHDVLFEEEGFAGNTDDYYNAANSYLPAVLESKRGLPIVLSLIYKSVAERLGLRAWGVGLPGHFVAGVEVDGKEMLVDPFAGGKILTREEAYSRYVEILGEEVQWTDDLLNPISNRHWLTRILQNLLHVFGNSGRFSDVAAVLEMEMLLWPDRDQLQRDSGARARAVRIFAACVNLAGSIPEEQPG